MNRWSLFFFSVFGLGLIGSCAYFVVEMYSGDVVAEQDVFQIAESKIHDQKGSSAARHDPDRYEPMTAELSPDMNPIGVYLSYEKLKSSSGQSEFTIEVASSAGEIVHSLPVRMHNNHSSSGSGGSNRGTSSGFVKAATFDVAEADQFQLRVMPGERQGVSIIDLSLNLRRNISSLPIEFLFGSIFVGIFGMGCGILSVLVAQTSRVSQAAKAVAAADSTTGQG